MTETKRTVKIYTVEENPEVLRQISKEVPLEEIGTEKINQIIADMHYAADHAKLPKGFMVGGLAAVQIGFPIRMFMVQDVDTDKREFYINPTIEIIDFHMIINEEGCLSVPTKHGYVPRYSKIKITYYDVKGKKVRKTAADQFAQALQHENDHLNGILFIDKLSK